MSSTEVASSAIRKLHFFPASFPDETLLSRLSRYHLLSAELEDANTFKLLFGEPATNINFNGAAPYGLKILTRQLAGLPRKHLGAILAENSFIALVLPIIAEPDWNYPDPQFAEANLCHLCAAEDCANPVIGVPYIHDAYSGDRDR